MFYNLLDCVTFFYKNRERERVGGGGREEEEGRKAVCGGFVISHTFLETFCHVYFQHSSHANLLN